MSNSPAIIFNMQYRPTEYFKGKLPKNIKAINTTEMYDYYDRPEAVDDSYSENTKDAFDYYNYRVGSTGGFNKNGSINRKKEDEEIKNYKPQVMMRVILSFTDEFATEMGIKPPEKMKELVTKTMDKNLKAMGYDIDNVNWTAFYHTNTKRPHVHIAFYEKIPSKKRYIIPKEKFIKVKRNFIKELHLSIEHYVVRDDYKNSLMNTLNKIGLPKNIIKNLSQAQNNSKKNYKKNNKLYKKIVALETVLPKSGSMKYNSTNILPFKEKINDIIDTILLDKRIHPLFNDYLKQLDKEVILQESLFGDGQKMYKNKDGTQTQGVGDYKKLQGQFKQIKIDQVYTQIGNMILQNILMYRKDIMGEEKEQSIKKDSSKTITKKSIYKKRNLKTRVNNAYHFTTQSIATDIEKSYWAQQNIESTLDNAMKIAKEQANI